MTTHGQDKIRFKFRCATGNATGTLEPDMTIKILYEKETDTHYISQGSQQETEDTLKRAELERVLYRDYLQGEAPRN